MSGYSKVATQPYPEKEAVKLQIGYDGPALRNGRIPMLALGTGLRGQALLIRRVKDILRGEDFSVTIEVDTEFEHGSYLVPVYISEALKAAEQLLASQPVTALANLLQVLGFLGLSGTTLYKLFKRLNGRRIEKPDDLPKELNINISVELLIRIYNDPELQAQLRKTLDPLRQEGIEEFQTRRGGMVVDHVSKRDLNAADEAEIKDLTKEEEIDLGIEKVAWRRNLAWHFSDDRTSFDARIEDVQFWKRIEAGEAFSDGDRLRVHLRTTARRKPNGTLTIERRIPTVIDVQHVRNRQSKLFDGEQ
jgi:hypothetical protein